MRNLEGSSVILAGASGGLGAAIGSRLERRGARLVLVGRDATRLSSVGTRGIPVVGDLADPERCASAVATALSAHGRLDGVVNAAGVVAFGEVGSLSDEVIHTLLAANLIGPIRLMRAAIPRIEPGGFIVNLSAIVAEQPTAGMASYSATKAALTAFDRALVRELRRLRIDVIDVRPPHTETGLADRPVAGKAPRLPAGLAPGAVADRIVEAIVAGARELAASDFKAGGASPARGFGSPAAVESSE